MIDLRLGDCLEVMGTMPNESVDLVFTSPPYNVKLKYESYEDNLPEDKFLEFNQKWLLETFRLLVDGVRLYVVVSDSMVFKIRPIAEDIGFKYAQLLTWCKPNISGRIGKVSGDWNYLTEHILLFRKGKRIPMLKGLSANTHSFFVIPSPQRNWNKENKIHPAQFPVKLPNQIIVRTPGKVVFDPFMGSGSVGIASIKNNRDFIGIEIDPKYFESASKRIKAFLQQPNLMVVE